MFCLRLSGANYMRFEANKLKDNTWKTDGEVIVIDNDMDEFKQYFIMGAEVNWDEYKKNRPQDKLNMDEIKNISDYRKQNFGDNRASIH